MNMSVSLCGGTTCGMLWVKQEQKQTMAFSSPWAIVSYKTAWEKRKKKKDRIHKKNKNLQKCVGFI